MVEALRDGQIDGFCAGEPWNSLAVATGIAHIVTPTTAIWHRSPEKVLGMRANWHGCWRGRNSSASPRQTSRAA